MRLLLCFLLLSLWHASDAENSFLSCKEFICQRKRLLLFTIKAHTGRSAFVEYNDHTKPGLAEAFIRPENVYCNVFRSSLLNNLPKIIEKTGFKTIHTEMRKNGQTVASAVFDVGRDANHLNSENWFKPNRLLKTHPYWTGNRDTDFVDMSIKGAYNRSFYMHHSYGGCEADTGLMGIKDSKDDGCSWVTRGGKPPILFYAKKRGPYDSDSNIGYADRYLVYLTN